MEFKLNEIEQNFYEISTSYFYKKLLIKLNNDSWIQL